MSTLDQIKGPADLKALPAGELDGLAAEIRARLIESVSRTGGHLGPNLGVVELTIGLHRVFSSPEEPIVFDTGHQSYVHKMLTGRQDFTTLRQAGGLSGYPCRAESEHDMVENSHASTSLSWAHGMAVARRLQGETRPTVAVIGDGALTGGMAWEALNNIAADKTLPLVVVVNDNERSYAPTLGGMAEHLATLRTQRRYEQAMSWTRRSVQSAPVVGHAAFDVLHGLKKGVKDFLAPQGLFEDLGIKYVGPVDGHDLGDVENALRLAQRFGGPVIVHVITQKGRGYDPATNDEADRFHAVGKINPETGLPLEVSGRAWTEEFSEELVEIARERQDVVALTAAMLIPVGLDRMQAAFPERVFDVGIAEQHAATMAAGLSHAGMHPVVAIYSTFLNRAFDQLLMDCALHRQGVTFVLDRAGITGSDGASHNGMWDLSLLGIVPGLHLTAPRDGVRVRQALREAVAVSDAPTVLRFPKGTVPEPLEAETHRDGVDVMTEDGDGEVDELLVAVGSMVPTALAVAERLRAAGRTVRVVDPLWFLPVTDGLLAELRRSGNARVSVLEDGLVVGGLGQRIAAELPERRVRPFGVPQRFLDHASRGALLAELGLDVEGISTVLLG
ncbi:1-deoxy-D-xylulose-5-phosphate synthase [Kytococcus aerolatus]|uniref:1-deoxy-D-xylulose-5-phosphate synthase n=1 Tax=Kytococcus aerolatus TaxID=592308 RepID=A0A212T3Z9_9MICO|nr:1-deoxy-D-xylulose-5-phosphate synthase [Kytococcus aerolatus]SNC60504.1 1-deoxy-D-xylulose-5-phosphate synthase [Kytococcus aerolatus]